MKANPDANKPRMRGMKPANTYKKEAAVEPPTPVKAPDLLPQAFWLWEAFLALTGQRMFGTNGPQPLSIADMHAYAAAHEYYPAERRWMFEVIAKLDRLYIEETYESIKREQKKAQSKQERGRPARGR